MIHYDKTIINILELILLMLGFIYLKITDKLLPSHPDN